MFSTIKMVSRHQNTQQFGALLPIELTNAEIRNSKAYKEYYAVTTGEATPKPKDSVWRTRSSSDTSITPPTATAASLRLTASAKGKQTAKASKAKSLSALSKVSMTEAQHLKLVTSEACSRRIYLSLVVQVQMKKLDDDGDEEDKGDDGEEGNDDDDDDDDDEEGGDDEYESDEETREEESFDPIPQTPEDSKDKGDGKEDLVLNIGEEERHDEEEEEDEFYRDVNINQGREFKQILKLKTLTILNSTLDVGMELIFETTSQMDVQTPTSMAPLLITTPTMTSSTIATTTTTSQAPILPTTVSSNIVQHLPSFGSLFRFDNRLRIEQAVNEQLKAEVLTRSSHSSRTSYAVAADLSEMELKKILIEKIEGNKSIQRSDEQRNLYKAIVDAYESDKIILDTYGETVTLKRRRDDDVDKDEEPFAGPDRGRRDEEKERILSQRALQRKLLQGVLAELLAGPTYELMKGSCKSLIELEYHLEEVFKATTDQLDWVNLEGQQYPHNLLQPLPLIPDNRGRHVIPFEDFINNDLEYLRGEWHSYKHLDWITARRDDDKLYKFKEGDFKRLRIQGIEDMLLLLVQGKLTNLTVEERFAFNVSLRMFTRSIVIQRRVEDLQLGNKDKKNRLMWIDELNKFSDGTLNDVRTVLDDRLKGIRIRYLPQTIWRKSDKDRAATMIQAIDKRLKTRRIMRSLERFVGGRLYERDFKMLQRTI
nr:hypothetical protein [Tanacetum cinerariifolium]